MFFKILLLLLPLLLTSWSEASRKRFEVVLYKYVNQQGAPATYSAEVQCMDFPNGCGYNDRSAKLVHGSCVYLCPKPYLEISNPGKDCEILGNPNSPSGARTIDDMDTKVLSICDCTYRRGMKQHSEGEEDSRDLREINYYGSPNRIYYKKYFMH